MSARRSVLALFGIVSAGLWATGLSATGPSSARADDLFGLSANSGTTTVQSSSNSLIGLVERLSSNSDQFAPLKNQAFGSTLNYAGVADAIRFNQSFDTAGNRVINLQVPSVGVNQTFSSANGELDRQIRDYLKKQGLADLTAFQSVVGRQSAAGVVDGNPLAADMLLADTGYRQFALHPTPFDVDGRQFAAGGSGVTNRVYAEGGVLDAGGISGQYVTLQLATEFRFNDNLALTLTTPLRYQTLHSADVFSGGEVVGLPITILPAKGGAFFWQVTPAGHAAVVGSQDLVSGGLIYGGQVDSSFGVNLGSSGFTLALADNVSYFRGASVSVAGYDFNTRLDQWAFKNGLQLQKSFGPAFLDVSGTWTNFLRNTYVDGFFTPEVGVGFKFGKSNNAGFRLGYVGNFGNGYNTNGGSATLYFSF